MAFEGMVTASPSGHRQASGPDTGWTKKKNEDEDNYDDFSYYNLLSAFSELPSAKHKDALEFPSWLSG